ncbi:hypothetical protein ABZ915_07515 [Streptomyces sp. NPDC046915]|uniref:hypothetical protein n=1 Tax=Streptomyces sp. NPDC046915 TaxID=3155257 RepID=UPI0033D0BC48
MSGETQRQDVEGEFEGRLRGMLSETAYAMGPPPVPYGTIRRRGVVERRRRVAAVGAVLVTLAALPAGAYALGDGRHGRTGTAAPAPSASVPRGTSAASSGSSSGSPSASPSGPGRPATTGQLMDGITFGQAVNGLEKCLAYNTTGKHRMGSVDLGDAADYRIILAMHSTGDSNAPGDGVHVVAVKKDPVPKPVRLICTIEDGEAQGLNIAMGDDAPPDAGAVYPDANSGALYQQSFIDKGRWKLPFRWGIIGTVKPSVTKLTVSYGGGKGDTVVDHGWFVAYGTLHQQVTRAPHIKGYDAAGKLVYDSDQDKSYAKTLP